MRTTILARLRGEHGIALPAAIGVGSVMLILLTIAVSYATSGIRQASNTADWNAALAAAYAGIEEYQSRLADDPTYIQHGNPLAPFTAASASTVTPPPVANPAFGITAAGSWGVVPGSDGAARFRYEVDNSDYSTTGTVRLRSTGSAGGDTRTIAADLRQTGFIDFLYFTDFEIANPGSSSSCRNYSWARPSSCATIRFASGDVVRGPMHSNDLFIACNAEFHGKVTTSAPLQSGGLRYKKESSGCSPMFALPSDPAFSPPMTMPATNGALRNEVRYDLAEVVPGCLYTGPTTIRFNSNGTMTVRSPWTKKPQVAGAPATSGRDAAAMCGAVGANNNQLGDRNGATVPVPDHNLIFVQDVPSVSSDPNYWPTSGSSQRPSHDGYVCKGEDANDAGNGLGYPLQNEAEPSGAYECRKGDVFIQGTVSGNVTVTAEHFIYIVDDLRYADREEDMLGLISNNAIYVWNPVRSGGSNMLSNDRTIEAAILSVDNSFTVQNYDRGGTQGDLTVFGAIAQKFRGAVGTGSTTSITTGYVKDYNYDDRLRYMAPPKFLSPVSTTYGVTVWVEVSPAFDSAGVPR